MKSIALLMFVLSHRGYWLSDTEATITAQWAAKEQMPQAVLSWELRVGNVKLAGREVPWPAGQDKVTIRIQCPAVRVRTQLRWIWRLLDNKGKALAEEEITIHAFPGDLTSTWAKRFEPLAEQGSLVVVEEPRAPGITTLLKQAGLNPTAVDDPAKLALENPKVVLVAPGLLDGSPFAQAPLQALAQTGASVMLFQQGPALRRLDYAYVLRQVPGEIAWNEKHPLFLGLVAEDLKSLLADLGAEAPWIELPIDEASLELAYRPPEAPAREPGPIDALVVTKSIGKGRIVLSQLPLTDLLTDPRAQILIGNALDYLLSRPEPTPSPSKRRLPLTTPATLPVPTITVPSGTKP